MVVIKARFICIFGCSFMLTSCVALYSSTCVYVIDYMHTRFFCALSVTICNFLTINHFARIVTKCARNAGVFSRIVSSRSRTVGPKLADTKFLPVIVTMTPFSCATMAEFLFSRKLFANGDRQSRTDIRHLRLDIQVELPHFSNRDLYLLTVRALI